MAPATESQPINPPELAWLFKASEFLLRLNEASPIFMRHGAILAGPPRPHPECIQLMQRALPMLLRNS